jgi:hypothetical protein
LWRNVAVESLILDLEVITPKWDRKIAQKGENVGLSFYAFFANKNDDPELLMEAADWWIRQHQLDHFEKAQKVRDLIESGQ